MNQIFYKLLELTILFIRRCGTKGDSYPNNKSIEQLQPSTCHKTTAVCAVSHPLFVTMFFIWSLIGRGCYCLGLFSKTDLFCVFAELYMATVIQLREKGKKYNYTIWLGIATNLKPLKS